MRGCSIGSVEHAIRRHQDGSIRAVWISKVNRSSHMRATSRCKVVQCWKERKLPLPLVLHFPFLGELIRAGVRPSKCTHLPNGIGRVVDAC